MRLSNSILSWMYAEISFGVRLYDIVVRGIRAGDRGGEIADRITEHTETLIVQDMRLVLSTQFHFVVRGHLAGHVELPLIVAER